VIDLGEQIEEKFSTSIIYNYILKFSFRLKPLNLSEVSKSCFFLWFT